MCMGPLTAKIVVSGRVMDCSTDTVVMEGFTRLHGGQVLGFDMAKCQMFA